MLLGRIPLESIFSFNEKMDGVLLLLLLHGCQFELNLTVLARPIAHYASTRHFWNGASAVMQDFDSVCGSCDALQIF